MDETDMTVDLWEAVTHGGTRWRESDDTAPHTGIETVALVAYEDPTTGSERWCVWEAGAARPTRGVTSPTRDGLDELYERWVRERVRAQGRLMRESDVPGCESSAC